jgi:uncharacterized repeat protein (TIGR03803 family)/YD repeat-containing protein
MALRWFRVGPWRARPISRFVPRLEGLEDRLAPAVVVTESVIHPFGNSVNVAGGGTALDGLQPEGNVTLSPDGTVLYGRTYTGGYQDPNNMSAPAGDGTIFSVDVAPGPAGTVQGSNYLTLHNFTGAPDDGANPRHNAMALSPDGTTLYGMTVAGGSGTAVMQTGVAGDGVVFSYDVTAPSASAYKVLYPWGQTSKDGAVTHGSLVLDGSTMYGMTEQGGKEGKGILFSMSTDGSNVTPLFTFGEDPVTKMKSDAFGTEPHGTPLLVTYNGVPHLYGLTRKGGVAPDDTTIDDGVLFDYNLATGGMTTLHTFAGGPGDGATPFHGIPQFNNGILYGMTTDGGHDPQGNAADNGVLFSYNLNPQPGQPAYTVLHYFQGDPTLTGDGREPEGSVSIVNNEIYGVTSRGGAYDQGVFFRMNLDGSGYQVLFSFHDTAGDPTVPAVTEGAHPIDSVTPQTHPDGSITFYGMTQQGGISSASFPTGGGVIFAITVAPAPTTVAIQQVQVTPGLLGEAATLTAQVSSGYGAVNEGSVTFGFGGQTASAAVNDRGQVSGTVTLPTGTTGRPQTFSLTYSDPAAGFAGNSSSGTIPYTPLEAFLPSTTTFDPGGGLTVTDALFMLPFLGRSYDGSARITAISVAGVPVWTFQYGDQGQLTTVHFGGVLWAVLNYDGQGRLTSVFSPAFIELFLYGPQGQRLGFFYTAQGQSGFVPDGAAFLV